jgi:pyruvoyl-dependent arginine decarboxylase (PvlArgDC)
MNLLGWAGLYGTDRRLETYLSETRAEADAAATGYWSSPDRSNLGILYYRGVELLRSHNDTAKQQARALLRMSVESYRELGHHDVLPVALGMLAEAERLCGALSEAEEIATEAANLLLSGAPSLLNEAPVFLTLYKTRSDLGEVEGAKDALASSIRPLLRRLNGLVGGVYARTFLTQLPQNAELVSALDAAGLLPDSVHRILAAAGHV